MLLTGRSIKVRVTVHAALVMVATIALTYAGILVLFHIDEREAARDAATHTAREIAWEVGDGAVPRRLPATGSQLVQALARPGGGESRPVVLGSNLAMAGESPLPITWPRDFGRNGRTTETEICPSALADGGCLLAIAVGSSTDDGDVAVVAAVVAPDLLPDPGVALQFGLLGAVFVVIATAATWVSVGRSLRPVARIRNELEEISGRSLSRRVPVPATRDEISRLGTAVNATLDRLEDAVLRNERFVANASHELRSPVTALQNTAEVAARYPDRVDLQRTVVQMSEDIQRVGRLLEDLLLLARLDSAKAVVQRAHEPVDLADIVRRDLERRSSRVPISTDLDPHAVVLGNELELGRVLANLLDNAERFAESGIWIHLRIDPSGSAGSHDSNGTGGSDGTSGSVGSVEAGRHAVLEVCDDGPGIPPEDRTRVFERFTRLQTHRSRDEGGSGLGLALSSEIAEAHGGTLRVEDDPRGARFVLRLPADPDGDTLAPA